MYVSFTLKIMHSSGPNHIPIHVDDESGRFFDRSAYSRMMDDVENGKIGVCIMKDLTRWGRDYLQVGNAMEIFRRNNVRFPKSAVRFQNRCG